MPSPATTLRKQAHVNIRIFFSEAVTRYTRRVEPPGDYYYYYYYYYLFKFFFMTVFLKTFGRQREYTVIFFLNVFHCTCN